jgi:hypothetical protein
MAIRAVLYSIVTSEWSTSILTSLRSRGTLRNSADARQRSYYQGSRAKLQGVA